MFRHRTQEWDCDNVFLGSLQATRPSIEVTFLPYHTIRKFPVTVPVYNVIKTQQVNK